MAAPEPVLLIGVRSSRVGSATLIVGVPLALGTARRGPARAGWLSRSRTGRFGRRGVSRLRRHRLAVLARALFPFGRRRRRLSCLGFHAPGTASAVPSDRRAVTSSEVEAAVPARSKGLQSSRRAPSSVVEHLTFNQVVVGSIPTGPTSDLTTTNAITTRLARRILQAGRGGRAPRGLQTRSGSPSPASRWVRLPDRSPLSRSLATLPRLAIVIVAGGNLPQFHRAASARTGRVGDERHGVRQIAGLDHAEAGERQVAVDQWPGRRRRRAVPRSHDCGRRSYGSHQVAASPQELVLGKQRVLVGFRQRLQSAARP
jgi:hypothetical protein